MAAQNIDRYRFRPSDELLFDANIWLFLYGPSRPSHPKVAIYSGAFKQILAAKIRVFLDVLVLSEFVNRYARIRHNLLTRQRSGIPQDFKQFRNTSFFKSIAQDIAADTKQILGNCTPVESGFATLDLNTLTTDFAAGNSDFNDLVLAELCRSKRFKLVTDDGDFKNKAITILTANPKLLAP